MVCRSYGVPRTSVCTAVKGTGPCPTLRSGHFATDWGGVAVIESRDGRRVVVTGVGVVAPCGIGATAFWEGLAKPPEPRTERRDEGFDPASIGLSKVAARRLDRFAQFAVAAA